MPLLSLFGTSLVALEHVYILTLEMFLWTSPRGRKAFNLTPEFAAQTKTMAANQGLYNGFLAAGLLWGAVHPDARVGRQLQTFFLGCVVVAGVYGGATASRKILFVQGVPAAVALGGVVLGL
jgi:putative membrane protein